MSSPRVDAIRQLEGTAACLPELITDQIRLGAHLAAHGRPMSPNLQEGREAASVLRRLAQALRGSLTDEEEAEMELPF